MVIVWSGHMSNNRKLIFFEMTRTSVGYKPNIEVIGSGLPVVTFVACMHGNEQVGLEILEQLKTFFCSKPPLKGSLRFVIANPNATRNNKRFNYKDLNRCFPGKQDREIEERIAHQLVQRLNDSDYLIDFHTSSAVSPPFVICRQSDGVIGKLALATGIQRIVIKPNTNKTALIDHVKAGIGIELGRHDSTDALDAGLSAVHSVLLNLGFCKDNQEEAKSLSQPVSYFSVKKTMPMPPQFQPKEGVIANFQLVRKESVLGVSDGTPIVTEEDFYPILYGEISFPDTLCWVGISNKKT